MPVNYEYLDAKSRIAGAAPNALYQDAETIAGVQQEAMQQQQEPSQQQAEQTTHVNHQQTVVDVVQLG